MEIIYDPSIEIAKQLLELNYPGATVRWSIDNSHSDGDVIMNFTDLSGDLWISISSFIVEKDGKVLARIQNLINRNEYEPKSKSNGGYLRQPATVRVNNEKR
jgi:hypothetical protein